MDFGKTVIETLKTRGNYKTFLKAVQVSGAQLTQDKQTARGYPSTAINKSTIFAPNDAAFSRLPPGFLEDLLERDRTELKMFVEHHTLPGKYMTMKKITGTGYWEFVPGGALEYEGLGPIVRVGNRMVVIESSNIECDNGIIHTLEGVIIPKWWKSPTTQVSTPKNVEGSTVTTYYGKQMGGVETGQRQRDAGLPSTTGGRRAMGLMKQLPFWMYGPPFNAAYQEDYEPISIAYPDVASIDYQIMPPGSVIVTPDSVNASEIAPVSGYSKYIGKTKRNKEGSALSDYSTKLPPGR